MGLPFFLVMGYCVMGWIEIRNFALLTLKKRYALSRKLDNSGTALILDAL